MPDKTPGAGTRIDVKNVTKRYAKSTAVDDVSLSIEPGEFITLLGPSGSGKTTTLNLIAGFTELTHGSIEIDGQRVDHVPAHKRGLGVVFQHYALFPHMTVAENIAFPLQQRKTPKAAQAALVASVLQTVGLAGYQDRFPKELSGGQQQRVAFARAMVFNPRALLMDEPLGALDKNLREKLQLEIKRIHQDVGRTFVFVTHDQEEALILSDRIAIFNNGRIEQVGTSADLYERPASLFVARFMGESTVFKAQVSSNGSDWHMDFHGSTLHGPVTSTVPGKGALVLRPEQLRVAESRADAPAGSAAVPVQVIQNIYLGSGHKYELRLPDGSTGIVRTPLTERTSLRPGDSAYVHWPAHQGVLLEDNDLVSTT
ncbi:ABC transporter ATP-binding protein [Specibacter cremeus]|uniref:ABC transporter ATP-binding protein n=1 Tax=Specibacter cremeus TaxID=1629051 RepID=UPI000F79DDB7|nr:ABC transporter ATP-binding protein [Specibacter cremeus]